VIAPFSGGFNLQDWCFLFSKRSCFYRIVLAFYYRI